MANEQQQTRPSKSGRHWFRRLIWWGIGACVVAGLAFVLWPKPLEVEVASAERRTLIVTLDEDGQARVKDRFVVSAPLTGNIARIQLQLGDVVQPGAVIAQLVPLPSPLLDERARSQAEATVAVAGAANQQSRAQIERARVAVELARTEADRARVLFAKGGIAKAELDRAELEERARQAELTSAEFGAKVAAHQLRQASAALGHYGAAKSDSPMVVVSPIQGRVLSILQKSEGVVQAGAPLVELGDPSALEVVADVLTSDAVAVLPNARAEVVEWGGGPLEARVRMVEPSAFTRRSALGVEEQRVNVVLNLTSPEPAWAALGDGYRATVRIETHRAENVVVVPQSALFRSSSAWAAYVVRNGKAERQLLEIGSRDKSFAEVVSGLQQGDVVIVHPNSKVVDGVKVMAR